MEDNYINKILKSRENRYMKQEDILGKYPFSLVSFTLNIPGAKKDSSLFRKIHNEGIKVITAKLLSQGIGGSFVSEEDIVSTEIKFKEIRYTETGPEAFISIDINALILKRIMVEIEEEHDLGRLFDIDVFDKNHIQISRSIIDKEPRKCLLCDELAIKCIRTKNHTYEELIKKVEDMGNLYEIQSNS